MRILPSKKESAVIGIAIGAVLFPFVDLFGSVIAAVGVYLFWREEGFTGEPYARKLKDQLLGLVE